MRRRDGLKLRVLLLLALVLLLRSRKMQSFRQPCLRLVLLSFERRVLVWMLLLLVLHRLQIVLLALKLLLRQQHLLVLLYRLFLLCHFRELWP